MQTVEEIHAELIKFVETRLNIPAESLRADPSFDELNIDSLSRLEVLLHGDDLFGSNVLNYLEDGLLADNPPARLSELAALIPQCTRPVQEALRTRAARSADSFVAGQAKDG